MSQQEPEQQPLDALKAAQGCALTAARPSAFATLAEYVAASRAAQGLPRYIEDPATLARLAAICAGIREPSDTAEGGGRVEAP